MVLTTKTNNEYKPVAGLRCCRLTGLNATSLKGQWWRLTQSILGSMYGNQAYVRGRGVRVPRILQLG